MRKITCLLLGILMILVLLVGCNADAPDPNGAAGNPGTTDEEPGKNDLSKGEREGDVYKNKFLGFEFTKPASWVYSTDEEIAAAMNIAVDQILGDNFKEALKNNPAIFDMMVVDSITRTNINVVYENLQLSFASNITEEQYVEAIKHQLSATSGMTISFPETLEKVKLGQTEFTKCVCETTMGGATVTQVFYLKNVDGYMASMTVTIMGGYTVAEIEAMFQ